MTRARLTYQETKLDYLWRLPVEGMVPPLDDPPGGVPIRVDLLLAACEELHEGARRLSAASEECWVRSTRLRAGTRRLRDHVRLLCEAGEVTGER